MTSKCVAGAVAAALAFSGVACGHGVEHEADRSRGGSVWGANYFPNIPLTTQDGEHVRFFDLIRGKVVAVNFIYTKCADSCPMETARMVEVQKLLGDRMGKDVFFFSISIDPEHDSPTRLKEYASTFHTGKGWTFLTGKEADVTLLRVKLGVYEPDLKKKDHNLGLLIGNQATGQWIKRSPFENPYVLATQLGSWLHNWKFKSDGERDYANAPEVRNISAGEEMFRARCASCHTVGRDDTSNAMARRIGPDLFNVLKRRERGWLQRWIMQPDAMLAEKDPTATALFAQYNKVAMPNQRLSEKDVDGLLQYLEEASQAAEPQVAHGAHDHGAGEEVTAPASAEHAAERAQATLFADTFQASPQPLAAGRTVQVTSPTATARASAALPLSAAKQADRAPSSAAPGTAEPAEGQPAALQLTAARFAPIFAAYDSVRQRLAADDLAGARSQASPLSAAASQAAGAAGAARATFEALARAAGELGAATDLAGARRAFGELSKRTVQLLSHQPALRHGRHLFLCPMAPGYKKWLQASETLENPYMGQRMPHCGMERTDWAAEASAS